MWSPALVGIPRLLLVAPGSEIPADLGEGEDWVRLPASERDVAARLANLEHRFREAVRLDDATLHSGSRRADLSVVEARIVAALLDAGGELVPRSALAAVVGPDPSTTGRRLHDTVHRLRRRLHPLGLDVFVAPRRGYALGLRIDDTA
jgi:DNA-binding winged helix-turn-helix (wHTH) protein